MMAALIPTMITDGPTHTHTIILITIRSKLILTPAYEKEEPPFFCDFRKDYHKHEVQHDALTEHPAEHRSEEIMKESSNDSTSNLHSLRFDMTTSHSKREFLFQECHSFITHSVNSSMLNSSQKCHISQ